MHVMLLPTACYTMIVGQTTFFGCFWHSSLCLLSLCENCQFTFKVECKEMNFFIYIYIGEWWRQQRAQNANWINQIKFNSIIMICCLLKKHFWFPIWELTTMNNVVFVATCYIVVRSTKYEIIISKLQHFTWKIGK